MGSATKTSTTTSRGDEYPLVDASDDFGMRKDAREFQGTRFGSAV